ncbi:hypothetical protein ACLB2K_053115 [Fragaria x ananassa]
MNASHLPLPKAVAFKAGKAEAGPLQDITLHYLLAHPFTSPPPSSSPSSVSYSAAPLNSSTSLFLSLRSSLAVCVASKSANSRPLTGVLFEPFEEVKKELDLVPTLPQVSLARQKYSEDSEAAVNEQINVEYNVSYVYHAMYAYFDRDNVALRGLAKFFKESSEEERGHAEKLMEYQNKRGGRVKLQSILMPVSEFDHAEKGDALYGVWHFDQMLLHGEVAA